MTRRWWIAGGASAIVAVVLVSYLVQPGASRAGQVVFLQDVGSVESHGDLAGSITLTACSTTPGGLQVTGRVVSDDEVALVVVSPGKKGQAGRAVGRAEAMSSSRIAGAQLGDFQLTLSWAGMSSEFALVDADSLGAGSGPVRTGPATRCPGSR
jgi:hypothetical protein